MRHFLLAIALCHSLQIGPNENTDNCQASSPDEKALLEFSRR
jgi:magnesium-transporting ATPase (P-type)